MMSFERHKRKPRAARGRGRGEWRGGRAGAPKACSLLSLFCVVFYVCVTLGIIRFVTRRWLMHIQGDRHKKECMEGLSKPR